MARFEALRSKAATFLRESVDTDQIVPARFLSTRREAGYGDFLFHDLRYASSENSIPDFLNKRLGAEKPAILIAGPNFGCGSSREAAVYALADFGFQAIVASSFGEIFYYNCLRNGLLPIAVPELAVAQLAQVSTDDPQAFFDIDLQAQQVRGPSIAPTSFDIDPFWKEILSTGKDEVSITLDMRSEMEAFEATYYARYGWLRSRRP